IRTRAERFPAYLSLFDLLWLAGRDLTGEPLAERKRLLREAVAWSDRVRWTEFREGGGQGAVPAGLPPGRGGMHRETAHQSVRRPPRTGLGEGQVLGPAGVRHRRLHRPAALPRGAGGAPRRVLRGRPPGVRRQGGDRVHLRDAPRPAAPAFPF